MHMELVSSFTWAEGKQGRLVSLGSRVEELGDEAVGLHGVMVD